MKIPFFGKKEYMAPQVSAIPERGEQEKTGTYIHEVKRAFVVKIFDDGTEDSLARAIGALDIAKDVVKQNMSLWHMKEAQRRAILVPNGNGKGGPHVI